MAEERTTPLRYELVDPPAKTPILVGRGAKTQGLLFELNGLVVLGREDAATLTLPFEGVSRRHVEIRSNGEGAFALRDLGSTNGTSVNGQMVASHSLSSGDRIRLGPAEVEFLLATPAEHENARRVAHAWEQLKRLSERELEVAYLVAEGLKSADIATRLSIGTRTVNTHLEHIYERLAIRSRLVLTRLVIEAGMEKPAPG